MAQQQPLRICLATAELAPFAKTGGLADVSAALSAYLDRSGHDVRVLMPLYARIERDGHKIEPVPQLQAMSLKIGPWQLDYSIDSVLLPGSDTRIYVMRHDDLFGRGSIYTNDGDEHLRFLALSLAAIEMCQRLRFKPHIFHVHDWHTAMIPLYLKTTYAWDRLFADTRSVLTIHNIGYQGVFPASILPDLNLGDATGHLHQDDLGHGRINFMKTGVLYADAITAVSPTYAREIQGPEYGVGLDSLLRERSRSVLGILNGVDYNEWDPATDPLIPANYGPDDLSGKETCKKALMKEKGISVSLDWPLVGIVSRLVGQKGFELVENVIPSLLARRAFSLAVLGSGESRFETFFARLQRAFPGRVAYFRGYNNKLAHWIEAGADMFLMPSLYEPCGLNQMYSLKYGTIPIVRETGGLADSVELINPQTGTGTGVVFRDYDNAGLAWAMNTALGLFENPVLWQKIMQNGMSKDFSWERQGALYIELFRQLSDTA